jgi:hypothetical protein
LISLKNYGAKLGLPAAVLLFQMSISMFHLRSHYQTGKTIRKTDHFITCFKAGKALTIFFTEKMLRKYDLQHSEIQ